MLFLQLAKHAETNYSKEIKLMTTMMTAGMMRMTATVTSGLHSAQYTMSAIREGTCRQERTFVGRIQEMDEERRKKKKKQGYKRNKK